MRINLILGIILASAVIFFANALAEQPKNLKFTKCESHDDCIIKGCCPAICINKKFESMRCPDPDIECEISAFPTDSICGCINNTCQFSHELFLRYNELKNQAINASLSDTKAATGYCDQMHGEHIFECYAKAAMKLLPVNAIEAIKICDRVADKYSNRDPEGYDCYSGIANEISGKDPDLAIELCVKASSKPKGPGSISYRESCGRDVAKRLAKTGLIKAFKACDITTSDYNFCKIQAIEIAEQEYINEPEKAMKVLVESNICAVAGFSNDSQGNFDRQECYITCARTLARNKNTEEAIRYCNQFLVDKHQKNRCFDEISKITAR